MSETIDFPAGLLTADHVGQHITVDYAVPRSARQPGGDRITASGALRLVQTGPASSVKAVIGDAVVYLPRSAILSVPATDQNCDTIARYAARVEATRAHREAVIEAARERSRTRRIVAPRATAIPAGTILEAHASDIDDTLLGHRIALAATDSSAGFDGIFEKVEQAPADQIQITVDGQRYIMHADTVVTFTVVERTIHAPYGYENVTVTRGDAGDEPQLAGSAFNW